MPLMSPEMSRSPASDSAHLVFRAATEMHRPTSLVIGPDWPDIQRSLAFRMARFIGSEARLVHGSPGAVLREINGISRDARADIRALVLPYVLHDFAFEGHDVREVIAELAAWLPNASVLAVDYTFSSHDPGQILAAMETSVEQQRITALGAERYLEEHRAFTPEEFDAMFAVFPDRQTVRFRTRTVLAASHESQAISAMTVAAHLSRERQRQSADEPVISA